MLMLKKNTGIRKIDPRKELLDEKLIARAVWESLKKGDSEGVIEVIRIYIEAINKTKAAKSHKGNREIR